MARQLKRKIIRLNGIKIFYLDTEHGRQTILCLHGRWGRGETWIDLINRYWHRYRIIAPDQRGHGLSGKPVTRYAPEDMASDMACLIKKLKCKPVIVVGHSMGGRIAFFLSSLYPELVKAAVILDIGGRGKGRIPRISPENIKLNDELTTDWPTPYVSYQDAVNDLSKRFKYQSNVKYFSESLYETEQGYDFRFSRFSTSAIATYQHSCYHVLPQITCPVLYIRATESIFVSRKEAWKTRRLIPHCTYAEISNSDHMVYADNPNRFYIILDKFLYNHGLY